jgi:hypothetical protein
MLGVSVTGPVAAIASDGSDRRIADSASIGIDELCLSGVAEQASFRHGPIEIDQLQILVSRRDIPTATAIPGQRRLQQRVMDLNEVATSAIAAADLIRDRILGAQAAFFKHVPHSPVRVIHCDYTAR